MTSFGAHTDVGKRYENNEDSIGWRETDKVWFVADGMGGNAGGEVASEIVKTTIAEAEEDFELTHLIEVAHQAILDRAAVAPELEGMGSTIIALRLHDNNWAQIVWVGDSRAYRLRKGNLEQLSVDQSMVQMLIDSGALTPEEARSHPQRNVVTHMLGHDTGAPEERWEQLQTGDCLLLCSDGLNDELTDDEITEILSQEDSAEDAAHTLVVKAVDAGGRDNVSAIVVHYQVPAIRSWLPAVAGGGAALLCAALFWYLLNE